MAARKPKGTGQEDTAVSQDAFHYPMSEACCTPAPASLPQAVREYVTEYPLRLDQVLCAVIEVHGLGTVLDTLAELFGNAGQAIPPKD